MMSLGQIYRATVLAFVLWPTIASAQLTGEAKWADSARILIESANNRGDEAALDGIVALLDRVLSVTPDAPMLLHYKGYAMYRRGGLLMGANKMKEAREVLEAADETLEASAKKLPWPETTALRAAVLGQIIGADGGNPVTAMRNGMKSGSLMSAALDAGKDNPRVWILKGSSDLFTPSMFGGGAEKAEASLKRALDLLQQDGPQPPKPAWGRTDVHLWLGQTYAALGRKEDARAEYAAVLELVPNHGWVKNQLLPALDKP
ncbi:MAG: tetratricopeptide repeat protein [Gemmatimonadaceae bacterium]